MPSDSRQHLANHRERYLAAALVGNWNDAKIQAMLGRRQAFTDEKIADWLYA